MAKNNNLGDFLTDIANAIRTKKGSSGTINAQNFSSEILSIPSGGGGSGDITFAELPLACEARATYDKNGYLALFEMAWQDMKDSETVLFDIPLALAAPNQEMSGITLDLYVGTNGQLQALYDACANETITPNDVYYVNNVATYYGGDSSGSVGFPSPLYRFGNFTGDDDISFMIGDLTPLGMGLGLVLAKFVNVSIPNNNIVIQQGFEFENESGIIIPNSVASIGDRAFSRWEANNQPLVIPNSVTSIGSSAFTYWETNNQPLVIPDSVTSIGDYAFSHWTSNNQPLVIGNSVTIINEGVFNSWTANTHPLTIPDSVTSIGPWAFSRWQQVPYIVMEGSTPPTLESSSAFDNQGNAPIYVPDASVTAYKNATNWSALASRIFSINEK